MQKKYKVIFSVLIFITFFFFLFSMFDNQYSIAIKKVDNFSPDRVIEVYKNDKKIEFKYLQYGDGTIMCTGDNPTISYIDLIDVDTVDVVLNDNRKVSIAIDDK